MAGFDGWEARLYGDAMALPGDELMHFRTKGSKNGVRRYQEPDGTWTPLGLRLRKAREGWGETRAERKLAKAKAKTARIKAKEAVKTKILKEKEKIKAEKVKAKAAKGKTKWQSIAEKRRNSPIRKLTDEELKKKIERAKMEQEYKELTKSPVLKTGEKALMYILEQKAKKADRKAEQEKRKLELARISGEVTKAKEGRKKAEAESTKIGRAHV